MSPKNTSKMTVAQAIVAWMCQQKIHIDGKVCPVFPGVFAIFGHGNLTCLGSALYEVQSQLPTYRGQNEQSMALAGIAYSKAMLRQQIMVATSSIGPGALNMVTAAGVAHANRLPLLIFSGDYFVNRRPDPVLQQVENFYNPSMSVNDAFKPVTRYWDRIVHPEQILSSLPQALQTMLDPSSCGPAFIGLCQDIQEVAMDYPKQFFTEKIWHIAKSHADKQEVTDALEILKKAQKPLIIAGGGVRYAKANELLAEFALKHKIPVTETVAGRSTLLHSHPAYAGPIGVIGSDSANYFAQQADVILAVGTRLQDFTTGSWSNFSPQAQFISLNTVRFDAVKHQAIAVVGDAFNSLQTLDPLLASKTFPESWFKQAKQQRLRWDKTIDNYNAQDNGSMHYGHIIEAVNTHCDARDYILTAAGGFPGELNKIWRSQSPNSFDCEYGFSCMGYEIAGGWGAKMARPTNDVFVLVGDGSYLMMNSDIYSSVLTHQKLIVIVCDNGGFAVINRLQNDKGGASFNNQIVDSNISELVYVDFAKHAESQGALTRYVANKQELHEAIVWAQKNTKTTVISCHVDAHTWSEGGCWWDVGVPEVSTREQIVSARSKHMKGRQSQRKGV